MVRPPAVSTAELLTVLEHDPAPVVLRTVADLLEAQAGTVPRRCLDDLLGPDRPAPIRARAARIVRAVGRWERLELDLRLIHDADPDLAATARQDVLTWATSAGAGHALPAEEQRQALLALLRAAAPAIDDWYLNLIRILLVRPIRP